MRFADEVGIAVYLNIVVTIGLIRYTIQYWDSCRLGESYFHIETFYISYDASDLHDVADFSSVIPLKPTTRMPD